MGKGVERIRLSRQFQTHCGGPQCSCCLSLVGGVWHHRSATQLPSARAHGRTPGNTAEL